MTLKQFLSKDKISFKNNPIFFLSLFLIAFLLTMYITNRILFAPKILLLCMIILVSVVLGKRELLLRDWFVFLSFIYLSDTLRGLIYYLTCRFQLPVHTLYVIDIEKFLFGGIPSVSLQKALLPEGNFTWLEKLLTILHGTHFIAFLFVGLIIWIHKSSDFKPFKCAFYLLISGGMFLYFAVPTVPPWMAANFFHILPDLNHFNVEIYNMFIPDLTSGFNTNPIGAMPSLHTGFPVLSSLILWRMFKWKALPFYVYTILVLFAITYTGDHYIVDILAGILLAALCYILVFKTRIKFFSPSAKQPPAASLPWVKRNKHLFIGAVILFLGISLGLSIKGRLSADYNFWNLYVPKYVDFINNQEDYAHHYSIQFYFGCHYLFHGDLNKAEIHLNNALRLSELPRERKEVLRRIEQLNCQKSQESGKTGT